jgi:hypothetical protein
MRLGFAAAVLPVARSPASHNSKARRAVDFMPTGKHELAAQGKLNRPFLHHARTRLIG